MREAVDTMGHNPGISLLAVATYWLSQILGNINEVVTALTGVGAFVLLSLTIIGKWYEVRDKIERKGKGSAKGNSGDPVADSDTDR